MSYRRGACPALSAPMQTGDGLLVRLATAGAGLVPAQLVALCAAAERHGNGLVEITARGNFQIRGLTAESATALADDIAGIDLGLRDGVQVETNPLAGLDPSETANAAPVAAAIREAIDATDLKARLAPKISVVVDGGGADDLSGLSADVRLTAIERDTPAWLVSTGGNAATATPLIVAGDEATATSITLTILDAVAVRGPAARVRDLAPADVKALLEKRRLDPPPPPPPAVPLPRFAGEDQQSRPAAAPDLPPFTGEGDHAKRGEGGSIALTDGRFALPVALPFGSIGAGDLIAFLESAQEHRIAELRLAPGRSLILIAASEASAMEVGKTARAAGLIVGDDDPRTRIFACPGSAGCASGHLPAREIAAAVARQLPAGEAVPALHISGCPKGCAHPAPAALTLVGTENGPALVENGTARDAGRPFAGDDIATDLAALLRQPPEGRENPNGPARAANALAHAGE